VSVAGSKAVLKPNNTKYNAQLVFLINLGEEIAADAMDVVGDKQAGSRSLPVLLGRENAL
jgi:hypothetical protein